MAKRRKRRKKTRPKKEAPASAPEPKASDEPAKPKPEGWRSWIPHLIGVFVVFHIVANSCNAIPSIARGVDRRSWSDPRVQHEMSVWSARFGMEQRPFEEQLYELVLSYQEVRGFLNTPFDPYMSYAGLRQSWLMFNAGTRVSDRFGVRIKRCALADRSCDWEWIYLHADDELDWRRAQIGHPRLRSMIARWGWVTYRERYTAGCQAIAEMAFEDFDDAQVVECGFSRTHLRAPDEPEAPEPEWGRTRHVRRRDVE